MIYSVALQNAAGPSNAAALKDSSKEPLQAAQSTRNRNAEAMIPIESKKVNSPPIRPSSVPMRVCILHLRSARACLAQ